MKPSKKDLRKFAMLFLDEMSCGISMGEIEVENGDELEHPEYNCNENMALTNILSQFERKTSRAIEETIEDFTIETMDWGNDNIPKGFLKDSDVLQWIAFFIEEEVVVEKKETEGKA
jgi:hypothetical protein